jgi:transketolase
MGEAVRSALSTSPVSIHCLAVRKKPKSGKPEELLDYEEISRAAIIKKVREVV